MSISKAIERVQNAKQTALLVELDELAGKIGSGKKVTQPINEAFTNSIKLVKEFNPKLLDSLSKEFGHGDLVVISKWESGDNLPAHAHMKLCVNFLRSYLKVPE